MSTVGEPGKSPLGEIDDLERRIQGAARRRRRIFLALGASLALVAIGPCVIVAWWIGSSMQESRERRAAHSLRATADQVSSVDVATRRLESGLPARVQRWRAGMIDAAALVPRPDLGPCPVDLPLRQPASANRGFSFDNLDSFSAIVFPGRQGFPHAVAHGGALPDEPPRVRLARERATELRERIRRQGSRQDLSGIVRAARALGEPGFWTYDVVLFADRWSRPVADLTGTSFRSGTARGIAVLFDYASGTAVCAGAVEARTTSASVEYSSQALQGASTLQAMLDTEFDAEVERAVATGLRHRAGQAPSPPLPLTLVVRRRGRLHDMRLEGHLALPDAPASQEPREIELAVRCEVVGEPGVTAVSWGAITAVGTVDPVPVAADRALGAHHWARCAVVARLDHVCPAAVRRRNACDSSRAIELGASCYLRPADGDEGTWESAPPQSCGDLR